MYDLIIRSGYVCDGTGKTGYTADIAVLDGHIVRIERDIPEKGREEVSAKGLAVAPGFIDIHSHSDVCFLDDPHCEGKLMQGVTSEVSGQCGSSIYPCPADRMENIREYAGKKHAAYASSSLAEYVRKLSEEGIRPGTNQLPLIGHGALRCGVMRYEDRAPSEAELCEMEALLERDLFAGAWGLSLGLGYTPGLSAGEEELCRLGAVVKRFGGVVTSHMRAQNHNTPRSLEEMYTIARYSGVHIHISHFKASGERAWGRAPEFMENVRAARASGIRVTADIYPYNASSSGVTNSFPGWSIQGGKQTALRMLASPEERPSLMKALEESFADATHGDRLLIVSSNGGWVEAEGLTLRQLAEKVGMSQAEALAELCVRSKAQAVCISFSMSEKDVEYMLAQPDLAIGSDGRAFPLAYDPKRGNTHPRNFGTFPRFLRLMREGKVCTLEEAVRRVTGLSADMMDIVDRGYLRPGAIADLTIFDPERIADTATFQQPYSKPEGIVHVVMAGDFAVRDGELTEKRLGRLVLKP